MIKRLFCIAVVFFVIFALLGCATDATKNTMQQSRKSAIESEGWARFDKSGKVRFLQVQTTAPPSEAGKGPIFDGSIGERLVEIMVDPAVQEEAVAWSLKNKSKGTIWVVATGEKNLQVPIAIETKSTATFSTTLDKSNYTYIVVDNESGAKTALDVNATCGGAKAKTVRGKSMAILWF